MAAKIYLISYLIRMFCCFPEIVVSVRGLNLLDALTVRGIKKGPADPAEQGVPYRCLNVGRLGKT